MGREPGAVVRQHGLGRPEDAHAPVAFGRFRRHEIRRRQPADQVVDLAVAGQPEGRHGLLEPADGEPGLPAFWVVAGGKHHRHQEDEEAAGLDQEPRHERIVAVDREEPIEIEPARLGHTPMPDDLVDRQMRHTARSGEQSPDRPRCALPPKGASPQSGRIYAATSIYAICSNSREAACPRFRAGCERAFEAQEGNT